MASRVVVFENRRDGDKAGEHDANAEPSMANGEVPLPCLVKPKTLVKEDLDRKAQVILEGNWDFLCTENEEEAWAAWQEAFEEAPETKAVVPEPKRKREESLEEREARRRREEQRKANSEKFGSDDEAFWASQLREDWNFVWSRCHGSFEDSTRIPPMRYTHKPAPELTATTQNTLQIFSAKVAEIKGDLQWPISVFGLIAIRDIVDHNRNIIFYRTRDHCQILTEKDRNLVLIGPVRAVVLLMPHPVTIEVDLKVKGTTETEDKDLSFLAVQFICDRSFDSRLDCAYTSRSSTLEFALGSIVSSVEATISMNVISGSWPHGFHGPFSVFATGICRRSITRDKKNADRIDHKEIVLLDSRGEQVLLTDDGKVKLSRRVVSVELRGKLKVSVEAWKPDDNRVVKKEVVFLPLKSGINCCTLHIGSCKMEVSVAWSLISSELVHANSQL